jgi:hypothetical protein
MIPAPVIGLAIVGAFARLSSLASGSPSKALARPKSRIFTTPSRVILMFAGFRSRCTTPFS